MDWTSLGIVQYETGYSASTLENVWLRYCGRNTPISTPHQLHRIYKYIHIYPTRRQAPAVLNCSKATLQNTMDTMEYLAARMQEIAWEDRLCEYNHTPHFPHSVTGIVDTFPVMVEKPLDNDMRQLLLNPKYGGCCYKFLCACDFLGRIIAFRGPFHGTHYDGHI